MTYKSRNKKLRIQFILFCAATSIALAVCVGAMIQAATHTFPATVLDGSQVYQVQVDRLRQEDILAKAQEQGMQPPGSQDEIEFDPDSATVTLYRQVEMYVRDQGEEFTFLARQGDTVEQALAANDITLNEKDLVTPGRDVVIAAKLTVEIQRCYQVTVKADGETQLLELYGGTVEDALHEAGVKITDDIACNYYLEEPLEDGMVLEIKRLTTISLEVDGKTTEYKISADTVGQALEKCDVKLGEEDRISPEKDRPLRNGMRIVIQRVKTVEEVEKEEIPFTTQYVASEKLSQGETQVLSAGLAGIKELTYRRVYVDGEVESEELISEKVTADPVKEIVLRGIGLQVDPPKLEVSSESSETTGATETSGSVTVNTEAGILTDPWGSEYRFTQTLTGTCTAYCVPGGTTSTGMTSKRGVIAVNPNVIPYGTRIYAVSPDGQTVYGYGVAGDTGGACMEGTILADLCYDSEEECINFGRRSMVLYILQ